MNTLVELLHSAGEDLTKNPENAGPLRKLQNALRALLPSLSEPYLKFLTFLLDNFIDDLFYNVVGDVPAADSVSEVQRTLFSYSGSALVKIAENVAKNQIEICNCTCVELVNFYLEQVARLDEILSGAR